MHMYTLRSGDVALVAATAKTVLALITGATRRAKVKELTIAFSSTTQTDAPVLVELVQFDTDGTGTAATPVAVDRADPAAIATAKSNYTAEPTVNPAVLWETRMTPIGGTLILQTPLGDEFKFSLSKTYALRMTAPQAQTARVVLKFEE